MSFGAGVVVGEGLVEGGADEGDDVALVVPCGLLGEEAVAGRGDVRLARVGQGPVRGLGGVVGKDAGPDLVRAALDSRGRRSDRPRWSGSWTVVERGGCPGRSRRMDPPLPLSCRDRWTPCFACVTVSPCRFLASSSDDLVRMSRFYCASAVAVGTEGFLFWILADITPLHGVIRLLAYCFWGQTTSSNNEI